MAVKATKQAQGTTQENTQETAQEVNQASPVNGTGVRRGPKGPRGPRTTQVLVWTEEMEKELIQILRAERKPNEMRTANVVAYELNKTAPFAAHPVTPIQVSTQVEWTRKNLPLRKTERHPQGMPVPGWLRLDTPAKRALNEDLWVEVLEG